MTSRMVPKGTVLADYSITKIDANEHDLAFFVQVFRVTDDGEKVVMRAISVDTETGRAVCYPQGEIKAVDGERVTEIVSGDFVLRTMEELDERFIESHAAEFASGKE